ncbi:cbb3-type cytochrome oxidase assembly protein CcoS [Ulvibacterium marinum]|uniref:Cbb3-type cytochrome oxidase assembly protein CcoS n=1 Tax=Ulvibacterium marinum TaxID=2419782 RepID=A0A3B0C5H9_9FLAO|nr:cbb3-type cytochrome oxidase assembly protein CcoS [Ulvibacterium marinum]RKN79374.1 cbb3-type cytochrome oxidase assembly protein CcoS [Ulvibacterium marinum]
MSVIYVLLAISIVVAVIFFTAFIISVRSGQYDDSYTPSVRMLFEDELVKPSSLTEGEKSKGELKVDKSTEINQ